MTDIAPTPPATLARARRIGLAEGLRYVYTGNVHDREGGTTHCPSCRAPLIERDWYEICRYEVLPDGTCPHCGAVLAGRFGVFDGQQGRRRVPVRLAGF
jgi:pyruvate formate lyase activating enzyme